ncbi:MAG: C-GCAxxG-C-C family (seleno)protein [Bacillota bacterium]
MPINTAKNHYLGRDGYKRMNCAQAIIYAFKDKFDIDESMVERFKPYGGGNAPEGACGAYYAAKHILEKNIDAGKTSELEKYFLEKAGAVNCREIRGAKKLSCLGCVEKCSEYLVNLHER